MPGEPRPWSDGAWERAGVAGALGDAALCAGPRHGPAAGGGGAAVTCGRGISHVLGLLSLGGDQLHNRVDDARTSGTRAQVYAGVFNLILEELVKFTTKFFY